MKKVLLLLFLIPFCGGGQEISGSWFWQAENGEAQMEITLSIEGSKYTGHHCSVFQNGDRIDCVDEDDPVSIRIQRTAENEFEGIIRSGYSTSEGKINLHFDPENETLLFELSEAPDGTYYLPKKGIFKSTVRPDTMFKLFKGGEEYKRPIVYLQDASFEKVIEEGEKIFFRSKHERFSHDPNVHSAVQIGSEELDSLKFYQPYELHELEEKEYTAKANKIFKETGFKPIPPVNHSILKLYIVRKQKSGYCVYEVKWM